MHWMVKCLSFHTFANFPPLYYLLQKRVTGRYFLTLTDALMNAHGFHVGNFKGGRALEFGAGPNLLCPLLLSNAGASEVLAIDLTRMAALERVNDVIRQLAVKLPGAWPLVKDLHADLYAKYRILYLAPADMRATELDTGSVDFICSTSTLEHIPPREIEAILKECGRLLTPDGRMSFVIDYHDHYCTGDARISRFNFYKYPAWLWRLFNPSMHYQNRLRHSDYVRLFAGFRTDARAVIPDEAVTVPLAKEFAHYGAEDLKAKNGFFRLAPVTCQAQQR